MLKMDLLMGHFDGHFLGAYSSSLGMFVLSITSSTTAQHGEMCMIMIRPIDNGTIKFSISSGTAIFDHDRHSIRAPGALP